MGTSMRVSLSGMEAVRGAGPSWSWDLTVRFFGQPGSACRKGFTDLFLRYRGLAEAVQDAGSTFLDLAAQVTSDYVLVVG
jgi:hypothetical protein